MAEERGRQVLYEIVEAEMAAAVTARREIWRLEEAETDETVREFLAVAALALTEEVDRLRHELRRVA